MTPEIKQRIQQIKQGKVPKGYKKTKDGLICEDWNVELLERLSNIYSGQSTIRISDGKYPVYGSTGIISSSDSYKYDMEQILVARVGAHAGYVQIASGKYDVSDNTLIVSLNKKCSLKYLYYHLINNNLNNFATGSGQPLITASQLKKIKLPLPPLPEQTAIAEILSTQDRVIELKEQLLAEKKRQKKYLMQQLLTGKMRLKGFKGEWKRCRIEDFCLMKSGNTITSASINDNDDYPCYGGNGLRGYTKKYTHSGRYVLIGRQGALCGNVQLVDGTFYASEHAIVVTPKDNCFIDFVYYLFDYMNLNKHSESSAQPGLSVEKILRLYSILPPLPEQTAIAEILSTADREIELLGQSIEAEKRKKKSLMQLLLTGIVRVN